MSLVLSVLVIVTLRLSPDSLGLRFKQEHPKIAWISLLGFIVWGAILGFVFQPGAASLETLAFQATMPGLAEEIVYRGVAPALLLGLIHYCTGPLTSERSLSCGWRTCCPAFGITQMGSLLYWTSSTSHSVAQLCGVCTETCSPGLKTGDPITPPEGYIGGLQIVAPIAVDPAGNVWVGNGWNDTVAGFSENPPEAL